MQPQAGSLLVQSWAPHHQLDIPTTAAFLQDIYPGKWQFNADAIATKINEAAACAKCHAEAALMSKYLLVESCEFLDGQVMEIWVGLKSHLKVSHTQQSSGVSTEVKFELPKSVLVEDLQDALEKAALEHQ
ncbi:hypothetical protein GYMLUDRAFT_58404 [Collybiopsis luxurians FD-317 M1]|uniref:Uncharacterized protein n=1 Tax=Collybiopsis luxurians FD-317 M1 TaxID=944289 RepID=A0A0D0CSB9_9AGAR|nr:hypothetical protein GYMLUDRAFT_58404 [Collybiopsis luxurians FD-317 M1]